MWLRLRQVALIASDADAVAAALGSVFGLEVAFIDEHLPGAYGLQNRLLPVGTQFLEICAPVQDGTAGGRYLERRGGDGGYMVICQCDDHAPRKQRVKALGLRVVAARDTDTSCLMQLHPQDTGGSFLEIDWHAGPDDDPPLWTHAIRGDWWTKARTDRVRAIAGVELQDPDPGGLARHWSEITEIPVTKDAHANPQLVLQNASIRFVTCDDGRPSGLGGVDLAATDAEAARAAAEALGLVQPDGAILIGGVRFRLQE